MFKTFRSAWVATLVLIIALTWLGLATTPESPPQPPLVTTTTTTYIPPATLPPVTTTLPPVPVTVDTFTPTYASLQQNWSLYPMPDRIILCVSWPQVDPDQPYPEAFWPYDVVDPNEDAIATFYDETCGAL